MAMTTNEYTAQRIAASFCLDAQPPLDCDRDGMARWGANVPGAQTGRPGWVSVIYVRDTDLLGVSIGKSSVIQVDANGAVSTWGYASRLRREVLSLIGSCQPVAALGLAGVA